MVTNTDSGIKEVFIYVFISIIVIVMLILICIVNTENFTAPGLTLTKPPSWFPQNAARTYNKDDWKSRMYLDRYPFRVNNKGENCLNNAEMGGDGPGSDYISSNEADFLASTYRMWRI